MPRLAVAQAGPFALSQRADQRELGFLKRCCLRIPTRPCGPAECELARGSGASSAMEQVQAHPTPLFPF
jgi:hypothetical protein